jgi:hypothetical protein
VAAVLYPLQLVAQRLGQLICQVQEEEEVVTAQEEEVVVDCDCVYWPELRCLSGTLPLTLDLIA